MNSVEVSLRSLVIVSDAIKVPFQQELRLQTGQPLLGQFLVGLVTRPVFRLYAENLPYQTIWLENDAILVSSLLS